MPYTIKQLADLSGVTVRTLHHYDQIGLLKPDRSERNKYRQYGEPELLKLQQILFFRELDFPLDEIKRITANPSFDTKKALLDQQKLLEIKKKRISRLIRTIDKMLHKKNKNTHMRDDELYNGFSDEEAKKYADEAKERWGNTDAYKQSLSRTKNLTKADLARIGKEGDDLVKEIAANMDKGPDSPDIQRLIARHYEALRTFYDPNPKLYRGLAEMYVADPRFAANYEKHAKGLAAFMRAAMLHYADSLEAE